MYILSFNERSDNGKYVVKRPRVKNINPNRSEKPIAPAI